MEDVNKNCLRIAFTKCGGSIFRFDPVSPRRSEFICSRIVKNALRGARKDMPEMKVKFSVDFPDNGCWLWEGAMNKAGYGRYRIAYELFVGPIPAGMHLDHLCHSRSDCKRR